MIEPLPLFKHKPLVLVGQTVIAPDVTDHRFPPEPPVATIVAEYGPDTVALGRVVVVMARAGLTVRVNTCVAVE